MEAKSTPAPTPPRPSIHDIARITGLSHGTISRAFNNRYGVSASTRLKILQAAEDVGYVHNSAPPTLPAGQTRRWGVLLPHLTNPYYAELFEYLDVQIRALGLVPHLALSHHSNEQEKDLLRQWGTGEIDAMIIDPVGHGGNERQLTAIQSWSIPVLLLHHDAGGLIDALVYDFRQSQERALQYLVRLGHNEIGYVGYHHPSAQKSTYYEGFLNFMRQTGLVVRNEDHLFVHDDDEDAGREIFLSWKNLNRRPTAVVCSNDNLALSLMAQCRQRSLRVPEDISILGRDDVRLASSAGLSTLRTDRREAAQAIVRLIHARIQNPGQAPKRIVLPSEFMVRQTIGSVPR